jgi:hypothetical protein
VLRVHDRDQRTVFDAVEVDLITVAAIRGEVHRLEAHPTGAPQHGRAEPQPSVARIQVQALGQRDRSLALLLEGILHRRDCVVHRDAGADIVVVKQ